MISTELLQLLRCPWDPSRSTPLSLEESDLVCQQCKLRFTIKDGFPVLIVEEAELPAGCPSLDRLPCQHPDASRKPRENP
jgi:uncharacterized protein